MFVGVRKLVGTYLCMWTQFALSLGLQGQEFVLGIHVSRFWVISSSWYGRTRWTRSGSRGGLRWSCRPHRTYDEVSYGTLWATKYVRPRSFIGVQPGLGFTRRMLPPSYSGPWGSRRSLPLTFQEWSLLHDEAILWWWQPIRTVLAFVSRLFFTSAFISTSAPFESITKGRDQRQERDEPFWRLGAGLAVRSAVSRQLWSLVGIEVAQ